MFRIHLFKCYGGDLVDLNVDSVVNLDYGESIVNHSDAE